MNAPLQPAVTPDSIIARIREAVEAAGVPVDVAARVTTHYLPNSTEAALQQQSAVIVPAQPITPVTNTNTPEVTMTETNITLAGPTTRILNREERSPINSRLSRAGLPTMGSQPTVQTAAERLAPLGVTVLLGADMPVEQRRMERSAYVPVEKTHLWKGEPVSEKQYNQRLRMAGGKAPENSGKASEVTIEHPVAAPIPVEPAANADLIAAVTAAVLASLAQQRA